MQLTKTAEGKAPAIIERALTLELVRVTERAAIAAAGWRGKGDEKAADSAAVEAMRSELGNVRIAGRIVIGEGERDEAPMLFIGEEVGGGEGPQVDIAVDPLEGTTLCAKNQPDSICVLAMAERGGLLNAPDVYMQKIAIGAGYAEGTVDLDMTAHQNIESLARAKGVPVSEITVCMLDRPRHGALLEELRQTGCAIKLISDGDIAGIIHAVNTEDTGIDIYLGSGGAPEGVLAAAALRCIGGQMQGRLMLDTDEKRARARRMGITDPNRKYQTNELASGDVLFAATGVTDGSLLSGVRYKKNAVRTSTVVMRSWSQTVRWITAEHHR
jgi:fructose-1,6-bisphosphatase II / sedoheptulose-1,7-bisphosphatase